MKLDMLWQTVSKVFGYKVSIIFLIVPLILWFILLRKSPVSKLQYSQPIEIRVLSDSIKIKQLEHEKDSIIIADYQYILQLKQMSKAQLEQEFHKEFSK